MVKEIRFFLEYMCDPFWITQEGGGEDTIDPMDLPISDTLKHDVVQWNRIFQSTFDHDTPQDSGFSSESADELLWKAFHKEGRSLFFRLKKELKGVYHVKSIDSEK